MIQQSAAREAKVSPLDDAVARRKKMRKRFIAWFLPIAVTIVVIAALFTFLISEKLKSELAVPQRISVQLGSDALDNEVARPINHLRSLIQREKIVQAVLDEDNGADVAPMVNAFRTLLSRNPEYAQIRWIGDDGMERVRVERTADGDIRVLPLNELQDKSKRYYVRNTLKQNQGEIFVSPLDLNVEHGQIEMPYHPMIRLGMRAFRSDGRSNGMFILNISAQRMLENFAAHTQGADTVLLNSDGYWLKSARVDDEWGFMFGKMETFGTRHPEIWAIISATREGQRETDTGVWTWKRVTLTPAHAANVNPVEWTVLAHLSSTELATRLRDAWLPITLGASTLLILLGFGIWRLVRETDARQRAEQALMQEKTDLADANHRLGIEMKERESAQVELAKSVANLERSNRELDEFAYIASHDLKEPLRGMHNYASFLAEDYADRLDDQGRGYIERIQRLAERQTALLNALLTYARIGQTELVVEPVDLDKLLDYVLEDLAAFLIEHHVDLKRTARLPVLVCNAIRVGEVLQNLIVNAAKYNDKDVRLVEIGCDNQANPPVFHVRDNGIGIEPQHQENVFRIFKRLHEQNRYGGGTGAGLTIVKKIIEKHGGTIWLTSVPGEGTIFHFTLSRAL